MGFTALIVVATGKFLWVLSHLEVVPTRLYDIPARNLVNFIVVMGIAWGVAAHVLGRRAGPVEHDERDLRLRFQADRAGDWALSLTVVASVVLLATACSFQPRVVAAAAGAGQRAHRGADREAVHRTRGAGRTVRARAAMNDIVIRNQIRALRLARGNFTQEQLAAACGVTRQTIIALEAGKYSPSLELAFKLALALGRTLDEVFQYEEKK